MSHSCPTCHQEYKEKRGLRNHKRYCQADNEGEEDADGNSSAMKRARRSHSPDPDPQDIDQIFTLTDTDIAPEREVSPETPPPALFSFSGRRRKVPPALKDYIPHSLIGLPSHLRPAPPKPMPRIEPEVPDPVSTPDPDSEPEADTEFRTESNGFGLYRQYTRKPRNDPEDLLTLDDLVDDDMPKQHHSDTAANETPHCSSSSTIEFFHPFLNATVFRVINWYLETSGTLSVAGLDRFAREVILSDDFNREDLRNFSAARELARLDKYGSSDVPFAAEDGWKKGSVTLHVPNTKCKHASESASPQFCVSGIQYRPLLELIKAACQSSQAKEYHWVPFKLVHQSPSADVRVYTDIYNSDAMLEEEAKIRALPPHPEDDSDTEVAVLAMLFWSDSTHLATFGTASLWPVYLYFGNHSKYARGRPNARTAYHVAYIPSVSLDPILRLQANLSDHTLAP